MSAVLDILAKKAVGVFSNKMLKTECTGFLRSDRGHLRFYLYVNGRKTHINTKFSHGSKAKVHRLVLKQLKINQTFFEDIVECPKGLDDYVSELFKKGEIEPLGECPPE